MTLPATSVSIPCVLKLFAPLLTTPTAIPGCCLSLNLKTFYLNHCIPKQYKYFLCRSIFSKSSLSDFQSPKQHQYLASFWKINFFNAQILIKFCATGTKGETWHSSPALLRKRSLVSCRASLQYSNCKRAITSGYLFRCRLVLVFAYK